MVQSVPANESRSWIGGVEGGKKKKGRMEVVVASMPVEDDAAVFKISLYLSHTHTHTRTQASTMTGKKNREKAWLPQKEVVTSFADNEKKKKTQQNNKLNNTRGGRSGGVAGGD